MTALVFAAQILDLMPLAIQGIGGAIATIQSGTAMVKKMIAENRDPTEEEWAELNAMTTALREKLHSDDK